MKSCFGSRIRAYCPIVDSFIEHRVQGSFRNVRDQVGVTAGHIFGLVSEPSVDEPLIDPPRRAIRGEGVAEAVPARNHLPLTARDRRVEVMIAFVDGDWHKVCAGLLAAEDFKRLADRVDPAGVGVEPLPHYLCQEGRQGHAAGGAPPLDPLLLADQDALGLEVEVGDP